MQEQIKQDNLEEKDWRIDITPKTATLKVLDGQKVIFVFQDEGKPRESKDFGNSVAFNVLVQGENEEKTFFVKSNNFDFLGQIKELGRLTGLKVEVSRQGSKKSDTRYTIKKVE